MDIIGKFLAEQEDQSGSIEAGDPEFPLVVNPETDLKTIKALENRTGQIDFYAQEMLQPYRGKMCVIKRAIIQDDQLVGYEIFLEGKTFLTPKKNIYTRFQYVEDIYHNARQIKNVLEAINHWTVQRDYYRSSWDGIEKFYLYLSSHVLGAALESSQWFKYSSSLRQDMDGISWRVIFKIDDSQHGVINCQSLRHDNVWTLNTTAFSTDEIDRNALKFISNEDLWIRGALWLTETMTLFQNSGYDYSQAIEDMNTRINAATNLEQTKKDLIQLVSDAYYKLTQKQSELGSEPISIAVTKVELLPGQISRFLNSDSYNSSLLVIAPKIIGDLEYTKWAMLHDLIHAANGEDCNDEAHTGKMFQSMAKATGLPQEFIK